MKKRSHLNKATIIFLVILLIFTNFDLIGKKNGVAKAESKTQIANSQKATILNEFKKSIKKVDSQDQIINKNILVIKFKAGVLKSQIQSFAKLNNLEEKEHFSDKQTYIYRLKDKSVSASLIDNLGNQSIVNYVEPDYKVSIENEPEYSKLWGLTNTLYQNYDVNIEPAWAQTKGSNEVIVAVIDTGIDWNHSDLRDRIWTNTADPIDGIDNDNNGLIDDYRGWDFFNNDNNPDDDNGHGTHVAGIIAASENGIGIVGVAPNVRIMPLKIADSTGSGYVSASISAIDYAKRMGATIINMSYGGSTYITSEYQTIQQAGTVLFVAAAGNDAVNNDVIANYPSGYNLPNLISVASIDYNGKKSSFSNYGISKVDVAAPGGSIYSTIPYSIYGTNYGTLSGTSMATPFVSGVAALVKSKATSKTPSEIKNDIVTTVTKTSDLINYVKYGGIVNAGAALSKMYNVTFDSQTGSYVKSSTVSYNDLIAIPTVPIRLGYTFGGWYKETSFLNSWNFGVDRVTRDITLYARWISDKPISVSYQGHVQNIGWQDYVRDGELSGTEGESLRVEGFKIKLENAPEGLHIKYKTHVQNIGWQDWVYDNAMAGTQGQSLRVEALQIMLEGIDSEKYSVQYQAHVQNEGWQRWVKDGEISGSFGKSQRIEALRIKITEKLPSVSYQGHVQNIGWQDYVKDGALAGTEGRSLRVEGFRIKLENAPVGLHIKYKTHVQNIGWQDWVYDDVMAGTQGQSLRVEALQIMLEGTDAEKYSIQYQAHVQNEGWQQWVKDGEISGSFGMSQRIEALRIDLVKN